MYSFMAYKTITLKFHYNILPVRQAVKKKLNKETSYGPDII